MYLNVTHFIRESAFKPFGLSHNGSSNNGIQFSLNEIYGMVVF